MFCLDRLIFVEGFLYVCLWAALPTDIVRPREDRNPPNIDFWAIFQATNETQNILRRKSQPVSFNPRFRQQYIVNYSNACARSRRFIPLAAFHHIKWRLYPVQCIGARVGKLRLFAHIASHESLNWLACGAFDIFATPSCRWNANERFASYFQSNTK